MSVNSKMTAIADEIRELSGANGTMGLDAMASNLSKVNDDVNSQADLIAQIASALEGKASGGNQITGEFTHVASLPKTLIAEPGSETFYYEIPENCSIIAVYNSYSYYGHASFRKSDGSFTSCVISTSCTINDLDNTGTVLEITTSAAHMFYLLPLFVTLPAI